jgi:outer membrane protein, heavy metal efflux system
VFSRSCVNQAVVVLLISSAVMHADPHGSLDLDGAIQAALSAGDIDAQSSRVEEARGRLQQRLLRPNPVVVYDRQDIFDQGNAPGFVQDLIKLEQPLRQHGIRKARQRAGELEIESVSQERRKIHEVRRAFARALEAQHLILIHQRAIVRARTAQDVVSLRTTAGESSKYESARMNLATAQERDLATAARVEFTRALADLGTAMSKALPANTIIEGRLPAPLKLDREAGERILETSKHPAFGHLGAGTKLAEPAGNPWKRRPEIAIEDAKLAQARADEQAIRTEVRPQFNVGLGYMHFDQTGLTAQDGYNAVVSVGLPLHDRRQGDIRAAQARAVGAQKSRDAAMLRILAEVTGAREHLLMANTRLVDLLEGEKTGTGEMTTMAETSYRAGLQSVLELLDAYRLERDLQLARVRAQGALLLAMEDYAYALGVSPDELWPQLKQAVTHAHDPEG